MEKWEEMMLHPKIIARRDTWLEVKELAQEAIWHAQSTSRIEVLRRKDNPDCRLDVRGWFDDE